MLDKELIDASLAQLLLFVSQLEATPPGAAELKLRIKQFGKCRRTVDESPDEFYRRLRYWLDRDISLPKSTRRDPRQTDD